MNTITTMFLIICLGYLLGRITIRGLSLGTSGIILVALVFGHFGCTVPKEIQNLGLICFVTAVGFIAGPVFFQNFRKKAFAYIILGILIILTGALTCIAAIVLFQLPTPLTIGLLCGALTSTPGLAAALEASQDAIASVGYGIAYPFGVLGVVLFVQLIPKLTKCDAKEEFADVHGDSEETNEGKPRKSIAIDPFGFAAFSGAMVLGALLGSIVIPLPGGASFSLGLSGGPLLLGLLAGRFSHIGPVSLSVRKDVLNTMREFGLTLFLLGAGVAAGNGFVAVLQQYGAGLFFAGVAMTILPMLVGLVVARKLLHLRTFTALGSICGGMTSTPALGSLIAVSGTDLVAAAYAATYPIALICVVLAAQMISILL